MRASYRKSNLPLAILAAGSLLLQLHRAGGQVLLNDGFLDGERLTQNLPTSAHWYSGGASSKVSFGEGGLILSGDTGGGTTGSIHGGGLAYFTVAGAPVSIVIGESITLSFEYGYAE